MDDRQIAHETEQKNAEMERQRRLAHQTVPHKEDDDDLEGHDKTDADSFPASDAPPPP